MFYSIGLLIMGSIGLFSCKKSPASISAGEYRGSYSYDTIVAGLCTTKVIEVNSLTVNFTFHGDSLPSTTLTDVEVNGGDQPYSLLYNGIEGNLTGTVTEDEMHWVLFGTSDTITFSGIKAE